MKAQYTNLAADFLRKCISILFKVSTTDVIVPLVTYYFESLTIRRCLGSAIEYKIYVCCHSAANFQVVQ